MLVYTALAQSYQRALSGCESNMTPSARASKEQIAVHSGGSSLTISAVSAAMATLDAVVSRVSASLNISEEHSNNLKEELLRVLRMSSSVQLQAVSLSKEIASSSSNVLDSRAILAKLEQMIQQEKQTEDKPSKISPESETITNKGATSNVDEAEKLNGNSVVTVQPLGSAVVKTTATSAYESVASMNK